MACRRRHRPLVGRQTYSAVRQMTGRVGGAMSGVQVNDRKAEERLKVEKEKIADKLAEHERLMLVKRAKAEARRLDMERNNEVIAQEIEAKAKTKAQRDVARAQVRA